MCPEVPTSCPGLGPKSMKKASGGGCLEKPLCLGVGGFAPEGAGVGQAQEESKGAELEQKQAVRSVQSAGRTRVRLGHQGSLRAALSLDLVPINSREDFGQFGGDTGGMGVEDLNMTKKGGAPTRRSYNSRTLEGAGRDTTPCHWERKGCQPSGCLPEGKGASERAGPGRGDSQTQG